MKTILLVSFLLIHSAYAEDFFDGLTSSDAVVEEETPISIDSGFKSKLLEIAKDRFSKGPSLFNYDSIHNGVIPDVGVFIGSKTVNRWSSRFLKMVDSPIRNIEYAFENEELGINLTIDLNYFMNKKEIDFLSPTLKPGEIFTKYRKSSGPVRDNSSVSKRDSNYLVEVGIKLRFPLLGNQELNTVHLGFRKTYFKTYYKSDYNSYLQKQMALSTMQLEGGSDGSSLAAAQQTVKELMAKLENGDDLTKEDQQAYKKASLVIDSQGDEIETESSREILEEEITSFESGSIMPFKLSSLLIKDVIDFLNKNKILSDYLDVEVLHYDETSAGLVKVSGLNRLIEGALPGLNIYFVGTRNDPMTGDAKIYIAGKLYE